MVCGTFSSTMICGSYSAGIRKLKLVSNGRLSFLTFYCLKICSFLNFANFKGNCARPYNSFINTFIGGFENKIMRKSIRIRNRTCFASTYTIKINSLATLSNLQSFCVICYFIVKILCVI